MPATIAAMQSGAARTLALVLALAAGPAPAGAAAEPRLEPPGLVPCKLGGIEQGALCGRVVRPLDPARPDGTPIEIHVAVIPALARRKQPDPVFFLAGGPGQSAIDVAPSALRLLGRLGYRRDLVFVDQRGTGRSAPLVCEPVPQPTLPLAEAIDPARQRERLAACRRALEALPHGDLRHYTTAIAVQDLDAVRRALGASRVNLVGVSYGTRVALEAMRQFPQGVRRAVLDGVAPPDMALPESMVADARSALDATFAACEADRAAATGCAARHPDLRARWQQLLARLPATVEVAHPLTGAIERLTITPETALDLVRPPLYAPALAAGLPAAIDAATQGRFGPLVGLASALGGSRGLQLAQGQHYAVICAEDMPRPGAATLAATATAAAADIADAAGASLRRYREICADWPRGTPPPGFERIGPAPAATLLLSGGVDPATPPRHGERAAAALGALARHVVVPQAGHGVMPLPCVREALVRFIEADDDAAALAATSPLAACGAAVPRPPAFVPLAAGGEPRR